MLDGLLAGFDAATLDGAALAGFDATAAPAAYRRSECAVFRKTREQWGGMSNFAAGFPIVVNGIPIRTSEALYQACRFPHLPAVQREIIAQASPMVAKWRSRAHHNSSRSDFIALRVPIMWWSLRVKLACNPDTFGTLLLTTGRLPIVEDSRKDDFWGAMPDKADQEMLLGHNVLGRLLMLLRDVLAERGMDAMGVVAPLPIADFLLYGEPIRTVAPWQSFRI